MHVTVGAALAAGMLSFLSPCVLPLVPPYLVYLAGASLERLADAEPEPRVRRKTIAAALLFVLGFTTVFVAFGAAARSADCCTPIPTSLEKSPASQSSSWACIFWA
jgi:cytochrome c-type biogenesis protein